VRRSIERFIRRQVAAALVAFLPSLLGSTAVTAATTHSWLQNGFTAANLVSADPTVASYIFNRAGSYGTAGTTTCPITEPYSATTRVLVYTSEARLASDISSGVIPDSCWPRGSSVLYDNEGGATWPTPENEKDAPETYMPLFNKTATAAGFHAIDTPGLDLGNTDETCLKSSHGGTNLSWYERCHIAGYAAMNGASGLVVQTQSETGTSNFETLYDDAEADVDGANSAAFLDAEVSINYGTAGDATTDLNSVGSANVDGVFIQGRNADAGTRGGWEDTVLTTLKNDGW
jgi:hypothetical protein